jgi:hypothetical protein
MASSRIRSAKTKLHGTYRTPRFRIGAKVMCEVRGELKIVGMTDAPIPWPLGVGSRGGSKSLVVYGDLVHAIRHESVTALCHWFGVYDLTVWKWRKVLGVPERNFGTRKLWEAHAAAGGFWPGVKAATGKAADPVRRAKLAAAHRGKRHLPQSIEKTRRANLGRKKSTTARRKMAQAWKRRRLGLRKPAGGIWKAWEDDLIRSVSISEVMRWTGRTKSAVQWRRRALALAKLGERPASRG